MVSHASNLHPQELKQKEGIDFKASLVSIMSVILSHRVETLTCAAAYTDFEDTMMSGIR